MIVVRTQVKDILKESGTEVENMSKDFLAALDKKVKSLVLDACNRAKANKRRTVMAKDV